MPNEPQLTKSHCNQCSHETKHIIRATHSVSDFQDVCEGRLTIEWGSSYELLECCGCSDVSLRKRDWFSESEGVEETIFPPRVSRRKPSFFDKLPEEYQLLLSEIYSALHADNRCLAMMGSRAVIDLFITRKVGDTGTFSKGMSALETQGFIGTRNRELFEAAIDVGHAAAHRAHQPPSENVTAVMDIIENLLQHDLLSVSVEALRNSTPQRPPRAKKKKDERVS